MLFYYLYLGNRFLREVSETCGSTQSVFAIAHRLAREHGRTVSVKDDQDATKYRVHTDGRVVDSIGVVQFTLKDEAAPAPALSS